MMRSATYGVRVRLLDPMPAVVVMTIADGLGARGYEVEIGGEPNAEDIDSPTLGFLDENAGTGGGADVFLTSRPLRGEGGRPVLGLASPEREAAIVSLPRVSEESRFDAGLAARVLKLVLHELGRIEGRAFCDDPRCLMSPAEAAADLDACESVLCERCGGAAPPAAA